MRDLHIRVSISGGGGSVTRLKSLIMKGHSRVPGDDGTLMAGTVTIKMLLPDNYLRTDVVAGVEKSAGYTGKTVLSAIRSTGNTEYPPDAIRGQILRAEKLRVARLLLVRGDNLVARYVVDAATHAPSRLIFPGSDKSEIVIGKGDFTQGNRR